MVHLNGNVICAVDVETTGDDPNIHEIVQISILPLDERLNVIKSVMPLKMNIKPERPERAQEAAMRVNRLNLDDLCRHGLDRFKAVEALSNWMYNKLNIPYNKSGFQRCRIIPLGANYMGFDQPFIKAWMDETCENYEEYFHPFYRDTMILGNILNDRAAMQGNPVMFSKVGLKDMLKALEMEYDSTRHHDSLYDCQITAQLYRKLMLMHMR